MVHTFEALGVKLAVDVNSGAVHVLDDLTYRLLPLVEPPMAEHCPPELLARLPEYRTEAVEEGWQDLRELAGKRLTEFRFILETLAESRQSGLTVGRDYLLEKGRNNNLILSQYEVREILATLEREQYVKISKGRGGTRITEKGLALLNEDLSTDLQ